MKAFLGLGLFFLSSFLFAQRGNLWVKNYRLNFTPQVTEVAQDKQGILYFAHSEGILMYDGFVWENLPLSFSPHTIAFVSENELWVAGKGSISRGILDETQKWQFEPIANQDFEKELGTFKSIHVQEKQVYFYSDKALCKWNGTSLETLFLQENGEMQGWCLLNNEIFLNIAEKGFCKLNGKNLMPIRSDFAEKYIQNFITLDKNRLLLACDDNLLWTFDGKTFDTYSNFASNYLNENFLEKITQLSEKEWVISTLAGGALILNKQDRSIRYIINQETGLADNEISAIFVDKQKDIWLCHTEGISKVSTNLPVYSFSHYPGLEGKPTSIFKKKDLLYVGTNVGLFFLSRSNKDDVSGQVTQEKQRQMQILAWEQARQRAKQKKQKGLKGFLEQITTQKKKEKPQNQTKIVTVVVEANVYEYNYSNFLLEQIPFNFRKISGIDSKCKQLIDFQGHLIALTGTGLYEITFGMAKNILEDKTIQYLEVAETNPNILYVCSSKGFFYLLKNGDSWSEPQWISGLQGFVFNCSQYEKHLWLAGQGKIWKLELSQAGVPTKIKAIYTLEKNSNMRMYSRVVQKNLVFFSNKIVLEKTNLAFDLLLPSEKYSLLKLGEANLFFGHNKQIWAFQEQNWQELNVSQANPATRFLSVLNEVQDVFQDENGHLWVATASGVFWINAWEAKKEEKEPNLFVRQIEGNDKLLSLENAIIQSDNEGQKVSIRVASPFFIGEENTQIQYRLKGLDDNNEWSEWRNQSLIEFPFLPNGHYELQIRSRNAMGTLSSVYHFPFLVKAPFWQTWWFYLIQIGVMIGLLLAAVIYNQRGAESRVASVITLVAIITIFEFIILLLEPVIDNFVGGVFIFKLIMNILLAVSLVPLEKKVRTYLQNSEYLEKLARKLGFRKPISEYFNVNQLKELAKNRRQG